MKPFIALICVAFLSGTALSALVGLNEIVEGRSSITVAICGILCLGFAGILSAFDQQRMATENLINAIKSIDYDVGLIKNNVDVIRLTSVNK